MHDPIVAEVREIRNAHSKNFNYDIKAISEDYDSRHNEIMARLEKIKKEFNKVIPLNQFSSSLQNDKWILC